MSEQRNDAGPARLTWRWASTAAVLGLVAAAWAWYGLGPALRVPLPDPSNAAEVRLQDFRDATYFPVRELLAGRNPYSPSSMFAHWPVRQNFNLYQPYHLVTSMPFALGGYRAGAVAFTLVSLMLLLVLAYLVARAMRGRIPIPAGFAGASALLLYGEVGKGQLFVGQVNPMIALGAAGTFLLRRTHPGWAAMALALAWLKPQFGFPIAVLLVFLGSWRIALRGTVLAAAASAPVVSWLIYSRGLSAFVAAIEENLKWAENTDYAAVDSMTARRPDLAAVFFRVVEWNPPGLQAICVIGALVAGGVVARRCARSADRALWPVADLLCLLTVVVAVVHQPGDVLIALPATAAVAVAFWRRNRPLGWLALAAVAAALVPHLHHARVDALLTDVAGARVAGLLDGLAIITAWVLLLVVGLRRTAAEGRTAAERGASPGVTDPAPADPPDADARSAAAVTG